MKMKKRFLTSSFIVLACIIASAQAKDDIFAVVHKIKPLQIENSVQSDNFSNLLKRDIIKHVNKTSNYISPYYIGEEELANANSEKKNDLILYYALTWKLVVIYLFRHLRMKIRIQNS